VCLPIPAPPSFVFIFLFFLFLKLKWGYKEATVKQYREQEKREERKEKSRKGERRNKKVRIGAEISGARGRPLWVTGYRVTARRNLQGVLSDMQAL
jgi:flagellar biosynthesis component FlhA